MEVADMGLILLIAKPFDKALTAVSVIAAPMILADTLGITIFAFTLRDMRSHHT
jgi:LytS/YehU family sensor histidine kinase